MKYVLSAGLMLWVSACDDRAAPPVDDAPPYAADHRHVCDWANVAGVWIAVECAADLDKPIHEIGSAAVPMGGGQPVRPDPTTLPATVDHRARFGLAKQQGYVGACTAFATTAAAEKSLAAKGLRVSLSDMHLWLRYCQPDQDAALEAAEEGLATDDQATLAGYPYDGLDKMGRAAVCLMREMPDPAAVAALDPLSEYEVTSVDCIVPPAGEAHATPEQFQRVLDEGLDIAVAVEIVAVQWTKAPGGVVPETDLKPEAGHAVLLVGYGPRDGKTYFTFRNSWGRDWGDHGYGYVSADYLRKHLFDPAFTITATCSTCLDHIPNCPPGQSASSADGACRRVCPDGTLQDARGMCPPPPTCAAGQVVDASNVCVRACAVTTLEFEDGSTGNCLAGACNYNIPQGVDGCETAGGCDLNCPAPTCGLGTIPNEFGVERPACAATER